MPYQLERPEDYEMHLSQRSFEWINGTFLPGVKCPKCGTWATTGLSYPLVSDTTISRMLIPENKVISVEEWKLLRDRVSKIIGQDLTILPGTSLGTITVNINGAPPRFSWIEPWIPAISSSAIEDMASAGFSVTGSLLNVHGKHIEDDRFIEIYAPPLFNAVLQDDQAGRCEICERERSAIKMPIVGRDRAFDCSYPVQRVMQHPTRFVVSDDFALYLNDNFGMHCKLSKIN
jgi:hypothetical protein